MVWILTSCCLSVCLSVSVYLSVCVCLLTGAVVAVSDAE